VKATGISSATTFECLHPRRHEGPRPRPLGEAGARPRAGLQSAVWNEADEINGADPDFRRLDMWNAFTAGDAPAWDLGVRLFDDDFADSFDYGKIDGGSSVLFEAVALALGADGAEQLSTQPRAHDFVTDTHVHCEFVGLGPSAELSFPGAGLDDSRRHAGHVDVGSTQKSSAAFVAVRPPGPCFAIVTQPVRLRRGPQFPDAPPSPT